MCFTGQEKTEMNDQTPKSPLGGWGGLAFYTATGALIAG
jgi:hypothetical protein